MGKRCIYIGRKTTGCSSESAFSAQSEEGKWWADEVSEKLGTILKNIHIPDEIVERIQNALASHQERTKKDSEFSRSRMEQRLAKQSPTDARNAVVKVEDLIRTRNLSPWVVQKLLDPIGPKF